jgi:DNA-binding transcriptional LysR family regulator
MKKHLTYLSPEIEVFRVITETLSISAAARKLGKDAGNLSRMLTKLENLQGAPLFVRHQGGLQITEAGVKLSRAIEASVSEFQRSLSDVPRRVVKVGFAPAVGFGFFGNYFPELSRLGLHAEFTFAPSLDLFELLKLRELDFILSPRSPKFPGIVSRVISSTRLCLVSRSGKPGKILVRSAHMFDTARRLEHLSYDDTVIVNDFFVAAKLLSYSEDHMGIIPECILENFPELKVLPHRFDEETVYAISWKGSTGMELLRSLKR